MFVKFRRELDGPGVSDRRGGSVGKVVPHEIVILESPFVKYEKRLCPLDGMQGPCRVLFEDPISDNVKECFEVVIEENGEYLTLYATGCEMFVMNNEGKTVDSISCAQ